MQVERCSVYMDPLPAQGSDDREKTPRVISEHQNPLFPLHLSHSDTSSPGTRLLTTSRCKDTATTLRMWFTKNKTIGCNIR